MLCKIKSLLSKNSLIITCIIGVNTIIDSLILEFNKASFNRIKKKQKPDTIKKKENENNSIDIKNMSIKMEDACITANRIRKALIYSVQGNDKIVYSNSFVKYLKKNSTLSKCYFPRNYEESILLYSFLDSILYIQAIKEEKAVELMFEIYLTNSNNAEISEYLSYRIIPKIALYNTKGFITVLRKYKENKQIKILQNLFALNSEDKNKLLTEAQYFEGKPDYRSIFLWLQENIVQKK